MSSLQAKTIQIFLPTGEPRGIRVAELTTRIVQAVAIPRSDLATAKARAELDHVAEHSTGSKTDLRNGGLGLSKGHLISQTVIR